MEKVIFLILIMFIVECDNKENSYQSEQAMDDASSPFELRMTLEHDPDAFTQGLVYYQDKILESYGHVLIFLD